jgi:hypothetical protein
MQTWFTLLKYDYDNDGMLHNDVCAIKILSSRPTVLAHFNVQFHELLKVVHILGFKMACVGR